MNIKAVSGVIIMSSSQSRARFDSSLNDLQPKYPIVIVPYFPHTLHILLSISCLPREKLFYNLWPRLPHRNNTDLYVMYIVFGTGLFFCCIFIICCRRGLFNRSAAKPYASGIMSHIHNGIVVLLVK